MKHQLKTRWEQMALGYFVSNEGEVLIRMPYQEYLSCSGHKLATSTMKYNYIIHKVLRAYESKAYLIIHTIPINRL